MVLWRCQLLYLVLITVLSLYTMITLGKWVRELLREIGVYNFLYYFCNFLILKLVQKILLKEKN